AAGLSLGLLFGLLLVLVRDRLDQRLRTAAAVSDLLGVPVLAVLPEGVEQPTVGTPRGQSYQMLANSLEFLSVERPLRTIALLSQQPLEASSRITAELALLMASLGRKTLLIDANLARPSQQERFQVVAERGLSSALVSCKAGPVEPAVLNEFLYPAGSLSLPM